MFLVQGRGLLGHLLVRNLASTGSGCGYVVARVRNRSSSTDFKRQFCNYAEPELEKTDTETPEEKKLRKDYTSLMRNVPQPVVVVTTAKYLKESATWYQRGLTCSSFTSISVAPPVVSFAIRRPSRMHKLLTETQQFAIHVLSRTQVGYGVQFASLHTEGEDQFEGVKYSKDEQGIPIIEDVCSVLKCRAHSVSGIGDHDVWYGEVLELENNLNARQPLLYHMRSFRTVGDEMFMDAFENRTLPFEQWTHEAHLRMAWNYIKEYGPDSAALKIKKGIQRFNQKNKEKISRGYHETVTTFYTKMVSAAMLQDNSAVTFNEFLAHNLYLKDKDLLWNYYSKQLLSTKEASESFVEPDKAKLPI